MVKFSKQFEAQIVPEWKEAFVDYWQLKKDINNINFHNNNNNNSNKTTAIINHNKDSSVFSSIRKLSFFGHYQREHGVIQVHTKLASSASTGDMYETELLEHFADTDANAEFFARLDLQLNKVNQFYRNKEKEFLERGESLKRQMEILVELKEVLKQQQQQQRGKCSKEEVSISGLISCENEEESNRGKTEQEQGMENGVEDVETPKSADDNGNSIRVDGKMRSGLSGQVFTFQGRNLRMKIPLINPSRAFSAISYLVWDDLVSQSSKKLGAERAMLHINKPKIHHAEKMIKGAMIELYKGLGYLKTYRNLNMMAFVKILKKFDKATNKQVLPIYLKVVESSYFNSSDKVMKLSDEAEEIFIKYFAHEDRRKAMKYLKPTHRQESHGVTFFIGLFAGCFVALLAGYVIMAHIIGMYGPRPDTIYMETVYPVLSMFSLMFLHFFLYGCNIFMWRKARINYSFIFEFKTTKELKYRDVFLICTTSMTVVMGVLFVHLTLVAKGYSYAQVHAIPAFLLLTLLLVLVCPFNIVYKSSRFCLLRVIRNIVLSPLYKVVMLDFFMADQLCSQVPMLRDLEYVACYYMTRSYKNQDWDYCRRTKYYSDLAYAVSFLPYYWRAMQCARRWFDEGQTSHLVNLGKYVSAMLAAGAKLAYEKEKSDGWFLLVVIISSAATMYQLYWDFVKDWGLLQPRSKNPWLRDELMLRRKFIYYVSMGLNLVLRLAWMQMVLHYNFGNIDHRITSLFLAALEVIRRGQWNFYRLENEHLNNAGKFRAVKTVPLPFHEVDEED